MTENKWENRLRLLFFGYGKEDFKILNATVPEALESVGLSVEWRVNYPTVNQIDVRAVIDDEDLRDKNGEWLRQVDTEDLKAVVDVADSNGPHIRRVRCGCRTATSQTSVICNRTCPDS